MKKLLLILVLALLGVSSLLAQRAISGTVTDENGEPLIGASILVKGTTTGTITDIDGGYSLNVPTGATTLVISYTGFTPQEVPIGASNVVDATLKEGVTLETAVVTALGVQRDEKALGYAVQEVGEDEILSANTNNVIDALSGKAAGVYVNQSSGAAGSSSRIVLRGQTSFSGNNEALMVIDGVRIDNSELNSERGLYGVANSNRGIDINPNDIASVTVLKGAAATALYGVEGARGVLLITTKKGQAGRGVVVDLSSNFTASRVSQNHELQDSYTQGISGQYLGPETGFPLSWGAWADTLAWDGSDDYIWDKNGRIVSQNDPAAERDFEPYDRLDPVFQTGMAWRNNLAISGGNDASNYRVSFGNVSENGVTPKNTFNRTNIGVNVGSKIFDSRFEISAAANYVRSEGRRIQQGSNISGIMLGLLRTPPSFDNANGFSDPEDQPEAYQFENGTQRTFRGGGGYDNPFWVINNTPFYDDVNRVYGNIKLAYTFSPWATLSTNIGTDFYSDNRKQEFERNSRAFPTGQVFEDQYNYRHIDAYLNLMGNGGLSDQFSLNYNVGLNFYDESLKQNYTQGDGLNFVGFRELRNTQSLLGYATHTNERTASVFGSLDLGYRNLLYLTLTGRNDWVSSLIVPTSEFKANDIAIFYPSASLSFVFSELLNSTALSFGKARLSFAQVGGGAPSPYSTSTPFYVPNNSTTVYSVNDGWTTGIFFPFRGNPGFTYFPIQGNLDLEPSKTTDLEVGLDLRFLNDRLGLDATYYTRNSEKQIIAINIPASTGFQRAIINSGELGTKGVELVLRLTPVRTRNFTWDMTYNFSKWRTLVESLPEGVPNQYLDGFEGSAIYNIAPVDGEKFEYGQIYGGAWQRANNDDGTAYDPDLPYNPSGPLIIDDSGSTDPDSDDYNPNYGYPLADPINRVIGNPNPDFLLGINNTLTYKGLSLSFLFDIKQGGDMWNGTKGALAYFGTAQMTEDRVPVDENGNHIYALANHLYEGVKASDGAPNDIEVPLDEYWYQTNGGGFGSVSEHFIEDASYYRLRYVTLSYNFGSMVSDRLSNLTLSLTGRNLLLFTPYDGIDPETSLVGSGNGQGLDYFQLPGIRSYSVGLSVRF